MHNYVLNLRVANDTGKVIQSDLEDELDLKIEQAKHERIKRHMSELKLSLMKGEVHKSSDVESVMSDMLIRFKAKMMGIPSKLTPQIANKDRICILEILTMEVNEILKELSAYNATDFYGKEYVDADEYENDSEVNEIEQSGDMSRGD